MIVSSPADPRDFGAKFEFKNTAGGVHRVLYVCRHDLLCLQAQSMDASSLQALSALLKPPADNEDEEVLRNLRFEYGSLAVLCTVRYWM